MNTFFQRPESPLQSRKKPSSILTQFQTVSLADIANLAYHDRQESKFLIEKRELSKFLSFLQPSFSLLQIEDSLIQSYANLYYDTSDFDFFHIHHNRRGTRYKIRERYYINTDKAYFEVKHSNNKSRTLKTRMPVNPTNIHEGKTQFLETNLPNTSRKYRNLQASLANQYKRITLVSRTGSQRLTIDLGLEFSKPYSQDKQRLPNLVIIELKEERNAGSSFTPIKRAMRLKQGSFSKYCVGCSLLYPKLKQNRFKPLLRKLEVIHA